MTENDPKTPSSEGQNPPEKQAKSWFERLGERSAGLSPEAPDKRPARDPGANRLWHLAGLGIQFATTVALFVYVGHQVDRWRGWQHNQALLTLTLIALFGNMYLLIKEGMKANK